MVSTPDKAALFAELEPLLVDPRQGADGRVWSLCPCHPDGQKHGKRSLSLHPRIGLTCFAGCRFEDILVSLRARAPSQNGHLDPNQGKTVATYEYRDAEGKLVAEKARIEYPDKRKQFRWRLPGGEWKDGLGGIKMRDVPLYGAEIVSKKPDMPVWFVEGEKAQRSMVLHGILAVTHGGGAGTKDFGDSLNILAGRKVILWPDNDPPGREYMQTIMARLSSIAMQTQYFAPPMALPEKGDADDYFNLGGTAEALTAALDGPTAITQPMAELMAEDAVTVTLPSPRGPLIFRFEDIETMGRRFDAELTIDVRDGGGSPYSERVNLLSSSQRTELRRELDTMYGKDLAWARQLNEAFNLARGFYTRLDRSLDVADAPAQEAERYALDPLLPLNAPTMFFGDGSASKTMLACAIAEAYAAGEPFLGMPTQGLPVLFVDWEDTFATFARRIRRIGQLPEISLAKKRIQYWPARGIPLPQQVDAIRKKVLEDGIGLVIYDSVALGCGGPPEDSVSANQFINAVKRIGATAFLIAHITKSGDEDKPFGSAFWHNSVRRSWLVKRESDEDTNVLDLGLICKKVNDGRKPRSIPIRVTFTDPDGPIEYSKSKFDVDTELGQTGMSVNDRIKQALRHGPMSYAMITGAIQAKTEAVVRTTMSRAKADYQRLDGGLWGLAQKPDPQGRM